jgi:hypothetical protein
MAVENKTHAHLPSSPLKPPCAAAPLMGKKKENHPTRKPVQRRGPFAGPPKKTSFQILMAPIFY